MYSGNLIDYIFKNDTFLSSEFCDSLIDEIKDNSGWRTHGYYDVSSNSSKSYDNDLSILSSDLSLPNTKSLNDKIWSGLKDYIDFLNFEWLNGWNGYSYARFNRYEGETEMRLHCDHIHSLFDGKRKGVPVLTVLGSLNEGYEGGEFELCGKTWSMPKGCLMIFPSNFLYPHKVNPIKKGIRYSYVSWTW